MEELSHVISHVLPNPRLSRAFFVISADTSLPFKPKTQCQRNSKSETYIDKKETYIFFKKETYINKRKVLLKSSTTSQIRPSTV